MCNLYMFPDCNKPNQFCINLQEVTQPTVIEQGAYILIAAGAFIFIVSFLMALQ